MYTIDVYSFCEFKCNLYNELIDRLYTCENTRDRNEWMCVCAYMQAYDVLSVSYIYYNTPVVIEYF